MSFLTEINLIVEPAALSSSSSIKHLFIYLFIYFKIHLACINVYNQYFKNLLYCQPETTKRVVSCFSRLLNLVNEQLSILEFKYNFNLHTIIKYIHAQSKILRMMNLIPQRTLFIRPPIRYGSTEGLRTAGINEFLVSS